MKIIILSLFLLLGNCVSILQIGNTQGFGPSGGIYSNYKVGISGNGSLQGTKTAKSCLYKISFLVAFGDAGIEDAALEAGIKKVYTVDKEGFGILNPILFHRLCTVITGE
jgi:hypothetical protein